LKGKHVKRRHKDIEKDGPVYNEWSATDRSGVCNAGSALKTEGKQVQ
jgi:hypothetical protein